MEYTWDKLDRPFTLRPLGKKVAVRWIQPPEKIGPIFMPQTAKSNRYRAVVVALGPDVDKLTKADIGRQVVTQLYTAEVAVGKEGDKDEDMLAVMDQDSILAVVEFENELPPAAIARNDEKPRRGR